MPPRARLHSPAFIRRRRRVILFRLAVVFFVPVFLIGALSYVAHRPEITIERVYVEGGSVLSEEEIRSAAREVLAGSYLYLFPKRNIFIYPRATLEKHLLANFWRIKEVEVSLRDLRSITVTLTERASALLWCGDEVSAPESSGHCYFLDEEGLVFAKAPDFTGNVFFRFYGGNLPGEPIGSNLLPSEEFKTLLFFVNSLRREGFSAEHLDFKSQSVFEVYLKGQGKLIFSREQDLNKALDYLSAFTSRPEFEGKDENGVYQFEYIDLQHGSKIYYKQK